MKKVVLFSVFLLFGLYSLYGMSVSDIVKEMNLRYNKIMERSNGIRITQTIKSIMDDSEISSSQTIWKKDRKYRIETISQMELEEEKTKNTILFDGNNIWFVSPFVGITMLPKDEPMLQGFFDDFTKLLPPNSIITGDEKIDNEDCFVIETPDKAEVPLKRIWISKSRFIPLKATGMLKNELITLIFDDYKRIEGIWGIPYKTVTTLRDETICISTIEKVETGVEIPNELFDVKLR